MASLKVKVSFPASLLEARELIKLGRFSGEELALSSWWIIFAAKIAVSGIMELVADMAADAKRAMRLNTFGIIFPFLCLSCIILPCLNPEMQKFAYSGIRLEKCEGTLCYYPLGESKVAASR